MVVQSRRMEKRTALTVAPAVWVWVAATRPAMKTGGHTVRANPMMAGARRHVMWPTNHRLQGLEFVRHGPRVTAPPARCHLIT